MAGSLEDRCNEILAPLATNIGASLDIRSQCPVVHISPRSHRQAFEFLRPHLTVDPAIDVVHLPRVVLVLEETQAVRPTVLTGNVDNFVGGIFGCVDA
jgi:hypothetical protein